MVIFRKSYWPEYRNYKLGINSAKQYYISFPNPQNRWHKSVYRALIKTFHLSLSVSTHHPVHLCSENELA